MQVHQISAKAAWDTLQAKRTAVLARARECAALTIPSLLPPEGHDGTAELPTPTQALGARGVNNLASKLLLTLFPPDQAFMKLLIDEEAAKELGTTLTDAQTALARLVKKVMNRVETSGIRPIMFEVLKHAIVSGNFLLYMPKDKPRVFRLDQFVCARDPEGRPYEVIVKERVHSKGIKPEVAAACDVQQSDQTTVDIYTRICWDWVADKVEYAQEINGKEVPGSRGSSKTSNSEWIVGQWQAVPGQDYGRGLCEEYLGDLRSLEGLNEAITKFAAVAAKILFLVHPNSTTDMKDVNEAESGDAVVGNLTDIDVLQLEKYADFQVADAVAQRIETRLSHAFLLRSGTVRDAERVTAEEIRAMAQELEDVLGGVYTTLTASLQLPFVVRLMAIMRAEGELPKLPEGVVEPVIVTGFAALGRNHAVNKLRAFIADVSSSLGQAGLSRLKVEAVIKRLAEGWGIESVEDLILSDKEYAAQQQRALMAEMATKAAPQLANALAQQAQT